MTLCTTADYTAVTGIAVPDADIPAVTLALAAAQKRAEEEMRRVGYKADGTRVGMLENDGTDVTETLRCYPQDRGRVYPSRTPVDSVSSPAGATIAQGGRAIEGVASGAIFSGPDIITESGYTTPYPFMATIVYRGGYVSATLPEKIRRVICRVAAVMRTPNPPVPAGAVSVKVGDTSVTYAKPQDPETAITDILKDLRGFRRDRVWP
jgi:hypothetical protein